MYIILMPISFLGGVMQLLAVTKSLYTSLTRMASNQSLHKVYVTRRIPDRGLDILRPHCDITQWCSDDPVPKQELLQRVQGVDALFCLLTDSITKDVLQAAGINKLTKRVKINFRSRMKAKNSVDAFVCF